MSAEPVTSAAVSAWSLLQKAEVLAQLDFSFLFPPFLFPSPQCNPAGNGYLLRRLVVLFRNVSKSEESANGQKRSYLHTVPWLAKHVTSRYTGTKRTYHLILSLSASVQGLEEFDVGTQV